MSLFFVRKPRPSGGYLYLGIALPGERGCESARYPEVAMVDHRRDAARFRRARADKLAASIPGAEVVPVRKRSHP